MTDREDWKRQVAEWRASGQSAEAYSRERGFKRTRLWAWSSRLRKLERAAGSGEDVRLVQVVRQRLPAGEGASVTVELSEARVHVRPGADRATLTAVLEAVDGLRRAAGASR